MNDALLAEIEALALEAGLGEEGFRQFLDRAVAEAAPPDGEPRCPQVKAESPPFGGYLLEPECRLVLDTFGQNRCNQQRWTNQRAAAIAAEQEAVSALYGPLRPRPALRPNLRPAPGRGARQRAAAG